MIEILEYPAIKKITYVVLAILVISLFLILFKKALDRIIVSNENRYRARKASNIFGYILVLSAIIFIYSDQLGALGVALGVTGAGVAFALQEVIVSFVGWLYIVFSNKVAVGQRVKIGNVKGDIIDIAVLNTTLMEIGDWVDGDLYNGRITNISNSFVFKNNIQNYSAEYPFLWDELTIPIRHESDYVFARKVFEDIAEEVCGDFAKNSTAEWRKMTNKFRIENANVNPMVSLIFDENWITFTIRFIVDYKKRRTTKDVIFSKILRAINDNSDKIKIATAAIEVSNASQNKQGN